MLKCSKCQKLKPYSAFHKRKKSKRGYQWVCKECLQKYRKRSDVRWKLEQYHKEYYKRNSESRKRKIKKHRKNPNIARIYFLIERYAEQFPLASRCIFCGASKNLEHGHLDYEDCGQNYVTVCYQCNYWMGVKCS